MCGNDFVPGDAEGVAAAAPHVSTRELRKLAIVIALVLAGFLAGVPPAMMAAIGAALILITRTRNPRLVYDEVDWGLLVFFVGLFLIVGGAENSGSRLSPPALPAPAPSAAISSDGGCSLGLSRPL
jgi:hypothetical protein